ncbi:MAG: MBL fold metallo-hydrolase [Desulfohalobiaceae bacterium]|nr:MBL fold metallo-hydrolase [Desulfohalobiaceae bacterium]
MTKPVPLRLHVVFNNVVSKSHLQSAWGFACLVEHRDTNILFDTGGDGHILLSNMQKLGLNPKEVDTVVLSHIHRDHTGGLAAFLVHNHEVTVYLPTSFPPSIKHEIRTLGARTVSVSGAQKLFGRFYSSGEMGQALVEQALIVDTDFGLVVITGCAHPNVAAMAERACEYLGKDIYLLMGGFHLSGSSEAEIRSVIKRLKALGVEKIAPSHCTGEKATRLFREAWGRDFLEGGLGAVIEVPLSTGKQ